MSLRNLFAHFRMFQYEQSVLVPFQFNSDRLNCHKPGAVCPGLTTSNNQFNTGPLPVASGLQTASSDSNKSMLSIRRSRHCRFILPISISTMFNQLACWAYSETPVCAITVAPPALEMPGTAKPADACSDYPAHPDALSIGVMHVHQLPHQLGKISRLLGLRHLGMTPATMPVKTQVNVRHPLLLVFIIHFAYPPGTHWLARISRPPPTACPPRPRSPPAPPDRTAQHTHPEYAPSAQYTPHPTAPHTTSSAARGFNWFAFKRWRMHSSDTSSMSVSATHRAASNDKVQRQHPAGGSLHAIDTSNASSCAPVLRGRPGRTPSRNAASRPYSTKSRFTRYTVEVLTPNASTISSSLRTPPSANNKTCARFNARTRCLPWEVRPPNSPAPPPSTTPDR